MKLLQCHVENFGTLSDFDFRFSDGLNVLCRENGFGKTTLAAFLKAMLYGLPKTRAKDNERRRYEPWQGGKYGGFLEFEYRGVQYRVTRYFEKKGDTFTLTDLTNRTQSSAFSERLGEELFQLDGDSFARSTFVPRLSQREPLATTSIRAKLSNLVEDTNDLNNYDTAMKQLQEYRKGLRLFKGEGGQIAQLSRERHTLEAQLAEAEQHREPLEKVCAEIEELNRKKAAANGEIAWIREQLPRASEREARALRQESLKKLRRQLEDRQQALARLDEKYPNGYPTAEECEMQREALACSLRAQKRREARAVTDRERNTVREWQEKFADPEKTAADLDAGRQKCAALAQLKSGEEGIFPEEKTQQTRWSRMFPQGIPGEEMLEDWERLRQRRDVLLQSRASSGLSEQEQTEYQTLRRLFASGVPEESEIREAQRQCRRIAELQGVQKSKAAHAKKGSGIGLLLFGLALVLLGAALFAWKRALLALALLLPGAGAMLWALLEGKGGTPPGAGSRELAELQRQRDAFLSLYFSDVSEPEQRLGDLLADRLRYADLSERSAARMEQRQQTEQQLRQLQSALQQVFDRFYPGESYDDGFLRRLRADIGGFEQDNRRRQEQLRLAEKRQTVEQELRTLLEPYGVWDAMQPPDIWARTLSSRWENYKAAAIRVAEDEQDMQELQNGREAVQTFLRKYGLSGKQTSDCIRQAEADARSREALCLELENTEKALEDFLRENGDLESTGAESQPGPEELCQRERQLQQRLEALDSALSEKRRSRRVLQDDLERIPEWEDRLDELEAALQEAERKCAIADKTMALLEKAKDALANSYVDRVERGFRSYADTLLPGQLGHVMVDKDLQPHMDARGAARDVESFSTGIADGIQLCMRFALVDALFGAETPFLILDDPFVNLDDEHTKYALALLKRLAEGHQILYLVCNSSRI